MVSLKYIAKQNLSVIKDKKMQMLYTWATWWFISLTTPINTLCYVPNLVLDSTCFAFSAKTKGNLHLPKYS